MSSRHKKTHFIFEEFKQQNQKQLGGNPMKKTIENQMPEIDNDLDEGMWEFTDEETGETKILDRVDFQIHNAKEFCFFVNEICHCIEEDGYFHPEDLLDAMAVLGLCFTPDFKMSSSNAYFKLIQAKYGQKTNAS
jgi:hypothetical protein